MVLCLPLNEENDVTCRFIYDIHQETWDKKRISHLQTAIKEQAEFNVPSHKLKLWKVSIPTEEVNGEFDEKMKILMNKPHSEINIEKELGGLLLKAEKNIRDFIDKNLLDDEIHIIVQTPLATVVVKQPIVTVKDAIDIALKDIFSINKTKKTYDMPVMERDFKDATEIITKNIVNCLKNSVAKTDFNFLVSGGAPGIGKTRFGVELFNYLKEQLSKHLEKHEYFKTTFPELDRWERSKLHLEYLYMDFENSIHLSAYDKELTSTVILGLRIAYSFFVHGKYDMTFESFYDRLRDYRETFSVSNVFDCIKKHLGLQSGEQLFIFLHIDEFQRIYEWDEQLFRSLIRSLSVFMIGPPYSIFVQTFLSGTAPQYIISTKQSSAVSFKFVDCPQLTFSAMFKIARHYAERFNAEKFNVEESEYDIYKWMICQPFLQLLEDTGGLPRALQYLFEECFKIADNGEDFFNRIDDMNFNTIFDNVKFLLQSNYNIYDTITKNKTLAVELLYHCIDAIPVTRELCLDPSDNHHTIENLERDAHIILNPINKNSTEFFIKMPFFFICIYNDKLEIVSFNLAETFRVQNEMYWQEWELFVAHYDAFRTNLLKKRGKQTAYLKDLYRGAYGTQSTMDLEVRLNEISVVQAREQFPCLKLTKKNPKGDNCINWEKGENVIVNGSSAKWGDGFVVRVTVQGQLLFIIHQDKYDYQSATFTNNKLLDEHIKNLETSSETKLKLLKIVSQYRHITIVFTTQPFENTGSYDNCLVVASNNFEKFFGPVFASRATFTMTKDINPNFSEAERIEKRLPGIGKVNAANIIKGRPYISKDHFYKKHDRAKRGIESYEEKNPNKKIKLSFYPFDVS